MSQIYKISYILWKMGINSSQPSETQQRHFSPEYYSSHHTPTFISSVATHFKDLSEFRGKLSFRQCTYTFATLYQQYSELIKRRQDIIISDDNCKVNAFGEITVSIVVNPAQKVCKNKFSSLLNTLFEIVNNLSFDCEWHNDKMVIKLKQRVKYLISIFENQQQLHNKILEQFRYFFQKAKTQSNLISAIYRQKQQAKRRYLYEDSFKEKRNVVHPSFANSSNFSSSFVDSLSAVSNREKDKDIHSILSHFHPKNKMLQNSETLSFYHNVRFQESFEKPLSITPKKKNKKLTNRLYITHQFSINIISDKTMQPKSNHQILKVKRDRYRTQTLGSSQSPQKQQLKKPKNRTTLELKDKKMVRNQRESKRFPKSVLDTMARQVQVQNFSSSKSYIY